MAPPQTNLSLSAVTLVALPTLPLPLPLMDCSLIRNKRARPEACSSAALATISALSASLSAQVRLWTGFSTTTSLPFLFSRPISVNCVGGAVLRRRCLVAAQAVRERALRRRAGSTGRL